MILCETCGRAQRDRVVPKTIRTEAGPLPLAHVFVTGSPDLGRRVRRPDRIVVVLDEDTLGLWLRKGARNLSELIRLEWASVSGPAELLVSTVPELADVLSGATR